MNCRPGHVAPVAARPGTVMSKRNTSKRNDQMTIEIKVPTLGESVTEATVGQWFKKPVRP